MSRRWLPYLRIKQSILSTSTAAPSWFRTSSLLSPTPMPEVKISAFPVSATETLQEAAGQSSPSSTTSSRMADRAAHHRLSHDKILDQSQAGHSACNQSTCRVQGRRNLYLQNTFLQDHRFCTGNASRLQNARGRHSRGRRASRDYGNC